MTDLPSGEALDAEARRGIIRSFLPGLIEEGYSQNAAISFFREAGLGIKDADFRALYREIDGTEIKSGRIKYVNSDSVPSDAVFDPVSYDIPARYRMIAKYDVIDVNDFSTQTRYITIDTDNLRSINEMEGDIRQYVGDSPTNKDKQIASMSIIKGFINAKR